MPDEAFSAFDRYSNSPHLDLCGVHLHIGSQNPESEPYAKAFTMLFESLLRVYRETGIRLKHINLGGGFPVNYLRDRSLESAFPSEQRAMFQADFEPSDAIREAWDAVRIIAYIFFRFITLSPSLNSIFYSIVPPPITYSPS